MNDFRRDVRLLLLEYFVVRTRNKCGPDVRFTSIATSTCRWVRSGPIWGTCERRITSRHRCSSRARLSTTIARSAGRRTCASTGSKLPPLAGTFIATPRVCRDSDRSIAHSSSSTPGRSTHRSRVRVLSEKAPGASRPRINARTRQSRYTLRHLHHSMWPCPPM